jgi:hypothetical protein
MNSHRWFSYAQNHHYITGYGYSTVVGTGWLSALVEAGDGVGLNFIIKKQPREKIISKIAQTTMVNRSRMREVGDARQDLPTCVNNIARDKKYPVD